MNVERMVRINQLPLGFKDLEMIVPQEPDMILIPKVENGSQIKEVDKIINKLLSDQKSAKMIFLMPIIESAKGIMIGRLHC